MRARRRCDCAPAPAPVALPGMALRTGSLAGTADTSLGQRPELAALGKEECAAKTVLSVAAPPLLPQLRLSTTILFGGKLLCVGFARDARNCRKAAPFTDIKSTMANNNLALSKRPRNIPTPNETVCASTAAARTPHTLPRTTDDKTCLPAHNCELNT
eukprot:scaffold4596_cov109-Isochrysis_galbana.AAC.2